MLRIWTQNDEQVWEKRKHKGGKSEAGATQSARQTPKEERPTNPKSVKGYNTKEGRPTNPKSVKGYNTKEGRPTNPKSVKRYNTKETERERYKGQGWTSCKQNHHNQSKQRHCTAWQQC